ncbi:hypothetical protein PUN28_012026 [Cardiocondyla obscurior]|uniref:Uncharacterized protein n=1 Tax=Cardiocondyla obscurior TaxID=286306 RepID=A0AAW2FEL7_9HYME
MVCDRIFSRSAAGEKGRGRSSRRPPSPSYRGKNNRVRCPLPSSSLYHTPVNCLVRGARKYRPRGPTHLRLLCFIILIRTLGEKKEMAVKRCTARVRRPSKITNRTPGKAWRERRVC